MKRQYNHGKPPASRFHNKAGNLTPYAFGCGYVERYAREKDRLCIAREPNDWHVKGFIDEKHVWEIFETLKAARAFCRKA